MKKPVLVIEDDRDIREPIQELLQDEGFTVVCSSSGVEALELLEKQNLAPGIILCDLMMPHMNGIDFVQNLKQRQMHDASRAVVLLSASNDIDTTAEKLGVGHLRKPIDLDLLIKKVHQYCD